MIFILNKDLDESQRLSRLLNDDGFQPVLFSNTDEVLNAIKKQKPACLIISTDTSNFDNENLLEDLIKLTPQLPVIIISDSCEVSDAVKAIRAGCFDYLEKPIIERRLLARVRDAIG